MMDKVGKIMQKMAETNYDMFEGDKDEAMEFLADKLEAFPRYANVVIRQQIMMPIWQQRFEGQEFRDKVQEIDATRRFAHESAISTCNILNRMSKSFGLEPFADIDTGDRHAVAEFVGKSVNEVYNDGIGNDSGRAFDNATYDKRVEYNSKHMAAEMAKLDRNYAAIQQNGGAMPQQEL